MLTVKKLQFQQGDFNLQADLSVDDRASVAIIGPSGGGKSTLLNCIAGFAEPGFGSVHWDGQDITNLNPGDRPISVVFQDYNLFPHLTAYQNVAIGLRPSMRLTQAQIDTVHAALSQVGLADLGDRKPAALSGGQQTRVALARVLVRDRPLLLLDEPFAALGPALRAEMLDLVAQLVAASGATLLMVTHEPADATRIASQTIYVEAGVVQNPAATDALMADPPAGLRAYLGR